MNKELALELVKKLKENESSKEKTSQICMLANLNPGDVFQIGKYDFIVLEQKDDYVFVISKNR